MEHLIIYKVKTNGYTSRIETYENEEYVVVPVVMMVEGVHSGSAGPVFHPITELGKIPEAWNGIPVVINHPQDTDGNYISANSPSVLEANSVGTVFSTNVDGKKLKSEAWLKKSKLSLISEDAAAKIQNNEPMEVSVGVFTDNETTTGMYRGKRYTAIARNHRPDHLALLPDQIGACSIEAGCGIRVNSQNTDQMENVTLLQAMQLINREGYVFHDFIVNKDSLNAIIDKVRDTVYAFDSETYSYYVEDVFDKEVIYSRYNRKTGGKHEFFKQSYEIADNVVTLTGNPSQVIKKVKVTYEAMQEHQMSNINTNETMAEKCTPCVKQRVDTLIANANTSFTEDNRVWLETLSQEQLDLMLPKEITPVIPVTPGVNADPLQALTAEQKKWLEAGKAAEQAARLKLVQGIQANTALGTWTDDDLNGMSEVMLKKIHDSVVKAPGATPPKPVNYSANAPAGLSVNANASDDVIEGLPFGNYEVK